MSDPAAGETILRPLARAPTAPPEVGDPGEGEIGRLRRRLNQETAGGYRQQVQALKPRYGLVWRDIALGYAALALVLVAVNAPSLPLVLSIALALLGAILVGYGLAFLQLFIHEAAHFNLAADRRLNDRLANVFIAWHLGADTAGYRMTHLAHHRNHGTVNDTERSYFHALTPRFLFQMLTGVHALRVFLGRAGGPNAPKGARLWPLARGVLAHLALLSALLGLGAWRSAIAWVVGVGVFLPFFATLRQILEHRSPAAGPAVDYCARPHGAFTRIFRGGLVARTFGGAGFDRHLLHHWEPQISYTRLPELETYLNTTSARSVIEQQSTTYIDALRQLLRSGAARTGDPARAPPDALCHACGGRDLAWWCSAGDPEYCSTDDRFDYYACPRCRALSIHPCPEDRLGEIYPSTYYSYSAESFSLLGAVKHWLDRRLFASVFRGIPGASLAAMDVGGGSGWLLDQARNVEPRLKTTVVVDINEAARPAALAAGHEFILSRIEDIEEDRRFDLITMLNLIEHVRRPGDMLAKARACLTDDGVLLIKTPNCDSLDARLFRRSYWGGLHSPRHWVLFTPEGFRQTAAAAGLSIERLVLTQGAPFWVTSVLNWMQSRGLARFSKEKPMYRHALFAPLLAVFAAFDFARRPLMRTSQMFVVLRRADRGLRAPVGPS